MTEIELGRVCLAIVGAVVGEDTTMSQEVMNVPDCVFLVNGRQLRHSQLISPHCLRKAIHLPPPACSCYCVWGSNLVGATTKAQTIPANPVQV